MSLNSISPGEFQPQEEKPVSSKRKFKDSEKVQNAAQKQISQTDKQSQLEHKQSKLLNKARQLKKRERAAGEGEQVPSRRQEESEDTLSSGPETKKRAKKSQTEPMGLNQNHEFQEELSMDDLTDRINKLNINDTTD